MRELGRLCWEFARVVTQRLSALREVRRTPAAEMLGAGCCSHMSPPRFSCRTHLCVGFGLTLATTTHVHNSAVLLHPCLISTRLPVWGGEFSLSTQELWRVSRGEPD